MKHIHFYRKPISMFVMVTFTILLCFWANQAPAAPAAEKKSEATLEQGDSGNPNFFEQEKKDEAIIKKAKKFPWLIVGLGAVVVGVALYFLVIKKPKYNLTVSLGSGTTGTPAVAGKYKKGTVVNYNYAAQAGYGNLSVKLDGVLVAANGSVNMDKDHTLDVSSTQQYTLTVSLGAGTTGTPAVTAIYNKAQVVDYSYTAQADYFALQVKLDDAVVAASGTVTMNGNHTLAVSATKITATYSNGVLTVGGVRYELASIPAGEFQMGSDSSKPWDDEEKPVHTVRISKGFRMGKSEVTQGLWQAVMGSNPSYFKFGDNFPVEQVSWNDCNTFIQKLNQMLGSNYFRLPTEAEWEYACRAGTTGDRYGDLMLIAWWDANSNNTTHPVQGLQPNAFGLYDTLGNVEEWCQDWYGPYAAGYQVDPGGPASGSHRVLRGGCVIDWAYEYGDLRASERSWGLPDDLTIDLGFRLARTDG